jgi:hypothetical protein
MLVPFVSLPDSSRVWIFQANRPMTADELEVAKERLRQFTEGWAVHGVPMDTSFEIRHNQFIILAADESKASASGCSIDGSVRELKEIQHLLAIDLFERNKLAFVVGGQIRLIPVAELKEKFKDGTLNGDTLTLNNLVTSKGALDDSWITPVTNTWLKRYLPSE